MEEIAYFISTAAGIFYLAVGIRLLRLSRRTRERPELLLGFYFVATGQWYVLYNAPFFLGWEELPEFVSQTIEWIFAVGIAPYLLFLRSTFRPTSAWAVAMVALCTLLLLTGSVAASFGSGFSNSLDDPTYLMSWTGYTLPCFWMLAEGAISHSTAKKRARIGLCEPVVANRYLLFAFFGFFQIAACMADLTWAYGNSQGAATASFSSGLLGATEIASVAVLALAFFPPPFYRRWIEARAALSSASVRET